jgi:hypothetical protein
VSKSTTQSAPNIQDSGNAQSKEEYNKLCERERPAADLTARTATIDQLFAELRYRSTLVGKDQTSAVMLLISEVDAEGDPATRHMSAGTAGVGEHFADCIVGAAEHGNHMCRAFAMHLMMRTLLAGAQSKHGPPADAADLSKL